jgi:predicted DNA-binding transcriptional regulator YafY
MVRAAVRELRAGDEAASAIRRFMPGDIAGNTVGDGSDDAGGADRSARDRARVAAMVSALTAAAATRERVWIGYVDSAGVARSRILKPERVEGGYLTAYDAARAAVHRLALHRITGVALLEPARSGTESVPAPPPLQDPGGAG